MRSTCRRVRLLLLLAPPSILLSSDLAAAFDDIEKNLTMLMAEKTKLRDESERLHGRGAKTLKDRTTLVKVEMRLVEVDKEISAARKSLLARPQ